MRKFLLILNVLLCVLALSGQKQKDFQPTQHFNYTIAVSAFYDGDYNTSMEYLQKELMQYPDNGYAYFYAACIVHSDDDFTNALDYYKTALQLLPKKDKMFAAKTNRWLGDIYWQFGQQETAISYFTKAVKTDPKCADCFTARGNAYCEMGMYSLASEDFLTAVSIDQSLNDAWWSLADCAQKQGDLQAAKKFVDWGMSYNPESASLLIKRGLLYLEAKEYAKAADDLVSCQAKNGDYLSYAFLIGFPQEGFADITARLRIQQNKEPENSTWGGLLGTLYSFNKMPEKALEEFYQLYRYEKSSWTCRQIADIWENLGDYATALQYYNEAIAADSTNDYNYYSRSACYYAMNDFTSALADINRSIAEDPEDHNYYNFRGEIQYYLHDYEAALENRDMALTILPQFFKAYYCKAFIFKELGNTAEYRRCCNEVFALDTADTPNAQLARLYALDGQKEKAIQHIDTTAYYDAFCTYALLNEPQPAYDFLEKMLLDSFRDVAAKQTHPQIIEILARPEFQSLIEKYRTQTQEKIKEFRSKFLSK